MQRNEHLTPSNTFSGTIQQSVRQRNKKYTAPCFGTSVRSRQRCIRVIRIPTTDQSWSTRSLHGITSRTPTLTTCSNDFSCFLGIFITLGMLSYGQYHSDTPMLLGSFGASSVLLFACPNAPLSQPRNALGGQLLSATVGLIYREIIPLEHTWIAGTPAEFIRLIWQCRWRLRRRPR